MLNKFIKTEIVYIKKFTENYENNEIIRFRDYSLLDMHMHNFTLIKSCDCIINRLWVLNSQGQEYIGN